VSNRTSPLAVRALLLLVVGVSCRSETRNEEQAAAVPPVPGRYSVQDFGKLRWLEGSWRGRLPEGGYFFERYRAQDDSTIVMQSFSNSTFAQASDSARITFRDGTIADEGSTRWVATQLDSNVVDFASEKNAANGFIWARESADRWKATLRSLNRERQPQTTIYQMERVAGQ
jgi:hypothetical protein